MKTAGLSCPGRGPVDRIEAIISFKHWELLQSNCSHLKRSHLVISCLEYPNPLTKVFVAEIEARVKALQAKGSDEKDKDAGTSKV